MGNSHRIASIFLSMNIAAAVRSFPDRYSDNISGKIVSGSDYSQSEKKYSFISKNYKGRNS